MKYLSLLFAFAFLLFCSFEKGDNDPVKAFLSSLNADQKEKVQLDFLDLSRENWHFFPAAMLPRVGLSIAEMNADQRTLLHDLLKSYLSQVGYQKVTSIMELENVLRELSGDHDFRDPDKYHVTFYGDPLQDKRWAWSFEGHHVSLNFTIVNDKVSMAPRFLGASPGHVKSGSQQGKRALANEEDMGLDLVNSMSEEQRKICIFQEHSFWELVSNVSTQVAPLEPVGLAMDSLDQQQQLLLGNLIYLYLSTMPDEIAKKRLAELRKEEFGQIRFGWAGATELGKPHYYRIQGKSFLIEFDNSQGNSNHIHTVWRDFDGDFGRDILREHYHGHGH